MCLAFYHISSSLFLALNCLIEVRHIHLAHNYFHFGTFFSLLLSLTLESLITNMYTQKFVLFGKIMKTESRYQVLPCMHKCLSHNSHKATAYLPHSSLEVSSVM